MRHHVTCIRALGVLLAALYLTAATLPAGAQDAAITGVVVPVGAAAAPERAALHLQLLDVTDPDGAARIIAEVTFNPVTLIDIPFRLPYDPAAIAPDHVYAVYGRLIRDDKTIYVSKSDAYVLTRGASDTVRITMSPASGAAPAGVGLMAGGWVVRRYADGPESADAVSTMRFYEDGSVGGATACNTWRGGFSQDGAALHFGTALQTQMACAEPAMAAERRFLSRLPAIRSWAIQGDALTLSDGAGAMVMELARQN